MRPKKPLLSPLVGISQMRAPALATIVEEGHVRPSPPILSSRTQVPTTTPKAAENEKSATYSAAFTSFRSTNKEPDNSHSKSGSTNDVNGMDFTIAEKRKDGSDESIVLHMCDHDLQHSKQVVDIGWTVPPNSKIMYNTGAHSKSPAEHSPIACATAVQEVNEAIIIRPLLHRQPVRSATLARQCVRGNTANKLHTFRNLSTGANAIPVVYTSDTSDDIPWI